MNLLLDVTARSSALLICGLLAIAALRRQSASLRHALLAATIFAAAAVPPLSWALPSWISPAVPDLAGVAAQFPAADDPVTVGAAAVPVPARMPGGLPLALFVWAAGFVAAAAATSIRVLRLVHASGRGIPIADRRTTAILAAAAARCGVSRRVDVLETDRDDVIATWGVFRSRILLPRQAKTWNADRLHAVLCHELAHIRRHDWLVQMGAEAVRAAYWFNPLVAIACRRLRRESELACDNEVLAAGVAAPDYAGHLLTLAQACRRGRSRLSVAMPMARPSTLERRISAMLTSGSDRRALSRRAVVLTILVAAAAAVPIAALRAPQTSPLPLTGAIFDPSGAVLPGVAVSLADAREITWQAVTDAAGQFEFPPVQPGHYVLEAKLPGFHTLRTEFDLVSARDWKRAITMSVGALTETITVSAARATTPTPAAGPTPVRVGGNIKAPSKVKHVSPVYPDSMRAAGLSGTVPIEAIIGADGSVTSARVRGAHVHPDFAAAALDAVRQWIFSPTLLNGRPVDVVMNVSVEFQLQ